MGKANTFDYKIYNDPMKMRDEQFLGEWDAVAGEWKIKGIFNYVRYAEELHDVIEEVKKGNYRSAKENLLSYYRRKYNKIDLKLQSGMNSEDDEVCSEALMRNVYSVARMNGVPVGFFDVDTQPKWHTIDILRPFNRLDFRNVQYVGYQLMSVDKTENKAFICSRKSEFIPFLELEINGKAVRVDCAKDTMVSAGCNSDKNYSDLKYFEVRESGIYHNHDERMKRAYFAFDISFIKETDQVTKATFHVYGSCEVGEKELYVYNELDAGWNETSFCWNNVTDELLFSCNDMDAWDYIGCSFPHIKGKICCYHRGQELIPLARRYKETKDEKYAYTLIRNFMSNIHFVGCNREVYNELDMGCYCNDQASTLVQIIDSKYLNGEYFCACVKNLYTIAKWLVDNYYGVESNNWASYATLGIYVMYSLFPEFALHDVWAGKTLGENDRLMAGFINPDGSCIELSASYHAVLIETIIAPAKLYHILGEPLPFSKNAFRILHELCKSYYYSLSPTYSDYNVADTTWPFGDLRIRMNKWYRQLPQIAEGDEELLYIISNGKQGKLPDFTTMRFKDGRRVYMKTDWTKNALAMTVTGKVVGSHGHRDVYSLAMMAYGRHLLTDQGYGNLLTGSTKATMLSSQNHNVLLADNTENLSYANANDPASIGYIRDAEERGFYTDEKYDFYELTGANNAVVAKQNRSVLFCKKQKFWIVTDYIKPVDCEKETHYDLYWHMLPDAGMAIEEDGMILRSNYEDGVNVMVLTAEHKLLEKALIMDSKYSPCEATIIDSKKACLVRKVKGQVTYTSVIIPVNSGEKFEVVCEALDAGSPDVNACRIEITKNGMKSTYYFGHNNAEGGMYHVREFETDAITMLVQLDESGRKVDEYRY